MGNQVNQQVYLNNSSHTRHPYVDDNRSTYIYKLDDPTGISPRIYIGMTFSPKARLSSHLVNTPKKHTFNGRWIKSMLARGVMPRMSILEVVPSGENYQLAEQRWIATLKSEGVAVTNLTEGGEGNRGYKPSLEHRQKVAKSLLGQKRSDESRARMSVVQLGHDVSVQTRKKISDKKTGVKLKPFTVEHRAIIAASKNGVPRSPETIAKMSLANIGKIIPIEVREKISASLQGTKRSFETRARQSAALKGKPKSPEHIAKLTGRRRSPETCAKISAAKKNTETKKIKGVK